MEPDFPNPLRLDGAAVLCSDGSRAGRVRDVYLDDDTGALAALTLDVGRVRQRSILVPRVAFTSDTPDDRRHLHVAITLDQLRKGIAPPDTSHVTNKELKEAAEALGIDADEVELPRPSAQARERAREHAGEPSQGS